MPRLVQRPDDREEVIGKRLEVYEAQTKPLIRTTPTTDCCGSSTRMPTWRRCSRTCGGPLVEQLRDIRHQRLSRSR